VTDPRKCVVCASVWTPVLSGHARSSDGKSESQTLIEELERDVIFYDESGGGVTISGGDP